MAAPSGSEVWRDYVTNGVPSSGANNPKKADIRSWAGWLESLVASGILSSGPWFPTRAAMTLAYAANTIAIAYNDPTAANNGLYIKSGASGSGSWTQLTSFLPGYQFVTASPTGESTPNAIVAATSPRLPAGDGVALVTLVIPATNTASPVTVRFDGGAALTIKTRTGENPDAGELQQNDVVAGFVSGSTFRLISDLNSLRNFQSAKAWANNDEDVPVPANLGGDGSTTFSAKHWAAKSNDDADRSEVAREGSEAARDIAAGYASDAVSQGNVPIYATVVGMSSLEISAGINAIRVNGYHAAGDGGGALYAKVDDEPVHAGKFQTADGSWWELVDLQPNIAMFGGGIDGINRMAAFCGYVTFPRGSTSIETSVTIDVPMNFQPGAYLVVASGQTLSLTATVTSPKQWIFRGDGQVIIPLPDEDSGEDVREFPVIWFGAFTQVPLDQAPAIQRALNALGNSREGKVIFDHGSYDISTGMTTYRGTELRGSKTRSTVFQVRNDGYPVFQTGNTACFFKDIQFEHHPVVAVKTRVFPWIHIKHDFCEIENIFHQSATNAIIVDGPNCKIRNVEGVYGADFPAAGSAQILIRNTGVSAKGIYCRYSSGAWPDYIIRIGTDAAVSVTAFDIDGIEYIGGSCGVFLHSNGSAVARGMVRGVNARGASGTQPQVVKLQTDGAGEIFSVPITDIIIPNTATAGITFQQNSSKSIRRVSLNDIQDAAVPGNCIEFIQTAGTINDIILGAAIDTPRPNDVVATMATAGGVTAIKSAIPGRRKGKTSGWTVPASGIDDGVTYHLQGASADVHLPNAGVAGNVVMSFKISSSNGFNLIADGGATINGLTSLAVGGNKLVVIAATRNAGNCQYFTQA